jgi:hypothetical protein
MPSGVRRVLESVEAQLAEPGWIRLSPYGTTDLSDDPIVREDALVASRQYRQRDPLYSRAIRLTRNYTFGRGISWRAADDKVGEVIQKFLDDKDNSILARASGQWELADRLLEDGEQFFPLFVNAYDGSVKISIVEPEEIQRIITHPESKYTPLYYERQWTLQPFDWQAKQYSGTRIITDYYPDWSVPETQLPETAEARRAGAQIALMSCEHCGVALREAVREDCPNCGAEITESHGNDQDPSGTRYSTVAVFGDTGEPLTYVYMTQLKAGGRGLRSLPPFYSGITWVKGYKGFMEDRATLTLAGATFAFVAKIKGNLAAVRRMASQWGSATLGRYGGTGGRVRREGAQTLMGNEAFDLQQMQFDSRAGNAYQDGRMLRQQVSAATDITEPDLTGDPSVGNLASMTAMNGPQLKGFESWQQLFKDFYTDVFDFVIRMALLHGDLTLIDENGNERDLAVEVDFPPIIQKDLPQIISAVASLVNAQAASGREYVPPKRLAAYILEAFGETDVQIALEELNFGKLPEIQQLPDGAADALDNLAAALQEAANAQ